MADSSRLGPWVRRFLLEHLIKERNLSRGTQQSYRDTLTLLIPFVARKVHRGVDAMEVIHVSADLVRMFLLHLEESRGCAISTRNQRLAALHSLARFVALHSPEHIAWYEEICLIPTNIYARVDLETKAKAIAHCEPEPTKPAKHWSEDKGLLTFLRSL
jgi:integrase/recombinase XerD